MDILLIFPTVGCSNRRQEAQTMSIEENNATNTTLDIDGEPRNKRGRSVSSPGKHPLAELNSSIITSGLLFLASDVNKKLRLVSEKNSFDGLKIKNVIVDGGCSSLVISIPDLTFLENMLEKYADKTKYNVALVPGKGISQIEYVLSIGRRDGDYFKIHLCTDILPSNKENCLFADSLQFALCLEDINYILKSKHAAILSQYAIQTLSSFAEECDETHTVRMEFTLLGQSVLRHVSSLHLREIDFFVNPRLYQKSMWETMRQQESALMEVLGLIPRCLQSNSVGIMSRDVVIKFFSELSTICI